MQKPQESLDDFFNRTEPIVATPPPPVSLCPTGEVEILKPLARWERPEKTAAFADEILVRPAPYRLSWFHRSLIFGGGLAMVAVIFLSAIFTAVTERSAEVAGGSPDTSVYSSDAPVDGLLPSADGPSASDIIATSVSPLVLGQFRNLRPHLRSNPSRGRVRHAAFRPRRGLPRPRLMVADFVPTTLIIYPENGEIKTRIEPQLTAVYRKPITFAN